MAENRPQTSAETLANHVQQAAVHLFHNDVHFNALVRQLAGLIESADLQPSEILAALPLAAELVYARRMAKAIRDGGPIETKPTSDELDAMLRRHGTVIAPYDGTPADRRDGG
ncbi:MAG TPA: hypothetical protein VMZ50_09025 [Phycisphaerae bacterium]|nr:hypothetical protein [Phycisphaerae bacterium]